MDSERAKFGGCKTINQPSRIVSKASWRDPFFTPFEKLSFPQPVKPHSFHASVGTAKTAVPPSKPDPFSASGKVISLQSQSFSASRKAVPLQSQSLSAAVQS
jgi:hypothetical protein